jgi:hypothetical protein
MQLKIIAVFALLISPAAAQTYLVEPDLPTAQARSAALWQSVECQPQPQCDAAQITKYLLPVQPLTDGTAAVVVPAGAAPGALFVRGDGVTASLTAPEQAALATAATLLTKLPWILTLPQVQARLTAGQIAALNAATDTKISTEWAAVKKLATVDLTDPQVNTMVTWAVNDGILTQAQANALLAWVAVAQAQ